MTKHDRLIERHVRTRYLVTLVDGEGFDGIVVDADWRHLVLADVDHIAATGDRVKADGQVWVPRERIAYMQQPKV